MRILGWKPLLRLDVSFRVETCEITQTARELRDSNCRRRCEFAMICFLKVRPVDVRSYMRSRNVAGVLWVTYLFRRPFVSP
jgi:hypothetical protein